MLTISTSNNSAIESEELSIPSPKVKLKKKRKAHKKKGNICYCLNLLEQYGPINTISIKESLKFFVSKIKLIKFNDHFDELLIKGKLIHKNQYKNNDSQSIPDVSFWNQRYYYYTVYDKGIQMDEESNLYN